MFDTHIMLRTTLPSLGAAWCFLAISGCTTTAPANGPTPAAIPANQVVAGDAPENLQAICANAAATKTRTLAADAKPTSSRKVGRFYQVMVDAGGKSFSCIIDDQGAVKAI